MGSIQNKRASGRGAPPEVYLPFFSAEGEESDERMAEAAKFIGWFCLFFIVIGYFLLFLEGAGYDVTD